VKLIEAAGKGWEAFERLLLHCDDAIAVSWLGQMQSTKGQGGLGKQDDAGESTMVRITRKDALLVNAIRDQVLKPWAADNYGDPEIAPRLRYMFEPPSDVEGEATADHVTAMALQAFKDANAPLDVRSYMEAKGYPLLTPEAHAAEKEANIAHARAMMTPDPEQEEDDDAEEEQEPASIEEQG
jgi:hypothetical protein